MGPAPSSYLQLHATTPEGVTARYQWELTSASPWAEADLSAVLLRVAGHLLVDQVRSEGLPELLRTLIELRDVYESASVAPRLPSAPLKSEVARFGRTLTSPPFDFDLE